MGNVVTLQLDPDNIEAYTPADLERLMRLVTKRLVEIIEVQRHNNEQWAESKRVLLKKRETAIWESFEQRPDAPKWVHEAYASAKCVDEEATAFFWERQVRSHEHESHTLRQIQTVFQSLLRSTDELINPGRSSRGRSA